MTTTTQPPAGPRHTETPRGLNQPWRGLLATGEVILAAAAVVVGVWCWHRGIAPIVTPVGHGHAPLVSIVFYGNWMSGAIGLCTVAALLLLDALRQTVLAVRTRRRRAARRNALTEPLVDDPSLDEKPEPTPSTQSPSAEQAAEGEGRAD